MLVKRFVCSFISYLSCKIPWCTALSMASWSVGVSIPTIAAAILSCSSIPVFCDSVCCRSPPAFCPFLVLCVAAAILEVAGSSRWGESWWLNPTFPSALPRTCPSQASPGCCFSTGGVFATSWGLNAGFWGHDYGADLTPVSYMWHRKGSPHTAEFSISIRRL